MKKILLFIVVLLLFSFVSCSENDTDVLEKEVELVVLTPEIVVLYIGQSYDLNAKIFPVDAIDSSLTWKSSEPEICSVENGRLTGISEGVSIISVKTENGKSASIKAEVRKIDEIKSFYMSELNLSLEVGEAHQLTTVAKPSSVSSSTLPLVWSSSNTDVATVDKNGKVTAVSEGSCLIYADVTDITRAVSAITVGNANPPDLSLLVESSVRDLPHVFKCRDLRGNIISMFELTDYEVKRELTADGVTVMILLKGTKTYDSEGKNAINPVALDMDLYMENDEFCASWLLKSSSVSVGEEVVFEFAFNAVLKPCQRIFYIVLRDEGSEPGK